MSTEQNKANLRRIFEEAWNKGDLAVVDEVIAPDSVNHSLPPDAGNGPEGLKRVITRIRQAIPDVHFAVDDVVAEGDRVAILVTMAGTHRGELNGIAATGKHISRQQMHLVRFENGRAVEHHAVVDDLRMLQQLGAIPSRQPVA